DDGRKNAARADGNEPQLPDDRERVGEVGEGLDIHAAQQRLVRWRPGDPLLLEVAHVGRSEPAVFAKPLTLHREHPWREKEEQDADDQGEGAEFDRWYQELAQGDRVEPHVLEVATGERSGEGQA